MKLKANAKINLTLDITGRRADGYHLIDSVMQSVSLFDTVTVEKANGISVACSNGELCGEDNIAFVAAREFFSATGVLGGADIFIEKNIPLSAGLGGGSADAAAVIAALNKIYDTKLKNDKLSEIALRVGADVPFCLIGGTRRVGGIGERLSTAPDMPACALVILKQGEKLSTGDMYRRLDAAPNSVSYTENMLSALKADVNSVARATGNAFEAVCDISEQKKLFENSGALCVGLSGSGPSVFALFDSSAAARQTADLLSAQGRAAFFALPEKSGIITE